MSSSLFHLAGWTWLSHTGAPSGAKISRAWLTVHLGILAVLAILFVVAGRGQYFFYDEWDFLSPRSEWNLLATHNGHLSVFPQVITTVIKSVFGLQTYWPYLLPAIAVHLVVVHLLWRVMVRSRSNYGVALLAAALFALSAPGAEDVLWAFQLGFMAPFAFGLGALLVAMRPELTTRGVLSVAALLTASLGFSGTAIPMVAVVLLYVVLRHGWRRAVAPGVVAGVLYGAWYLTFNRGPHPWDGWRADTPREVTVDVPRFVLAGFVDSVAQFLPMAALSAPLLVALVVGAVFLVRRAAMPSPAPLLLALALILFALLTAFSRVGLGVEAASAARYTYVYGLLLAPLAATVVTAAISTRVPLALFVDFILFSLIVYNGGGFAVGARDQAEQERTVLGTASAGLRLEGCEGDPDRRPSLTIAPQLTMADLCVFVERGQFTPVASTADEDLDALVNLRLTAQPAGGRPVGLACKPAEPGGGWVVDPAVDSIESTAAQIVRVQATRGSTTTRHAGVSLPTGSSTLTGLPDDVTIRLLPEGGSLCVFDAAD